MVEFLSLPPDGVLIDEVQALIAVTGIKSIIESPDN